MATTGALIAMSAQRRGTTVCDRAQNFAVQRVNPTPVVLDKSIALSANDISHLERWPVHFFFSLREC